MAQVQNSLEIFNERLSNLVNSHLLLADKAISMLLRCIASTPEFTAVVAQSLEKISYVDEFERSRVFYFKDGKMHLKFVLPNDKNRAFTLVVCLLSEIDSGRRNLLHFLHEYYPTPESDDFLAYQRFAQNVLLPFGKAGESILRGNSSTVFAEQKKVEVVVPAEESPRVAPQQPTVQQRAVPIDLYKNLIKELDAFCFKVENDASVSLIQKNECTFLASGLKDAILDKNEKLIRQLWIGFNNTLIVNNVNNDSCLKIQTMLEEANLY